MDEQTRYLVAAQLAAALLRSLDAKTAQTAIRKFQEVLAALDKAESDGFVGAMPETGN
jgi:hypothetical protein